MACNNFIAEGLNIVCDALDYKLVRPPKKLCTDNGVMIAWNGVERLFVMSQNLIGFMDLFFRWNANIGVYTQFDDIGIEKSSPLGVSLAEDVGKESISCKWVSLSKLTKPQSKWDEKEVKAEIKNS